MLLTAHATKTLSPTQPPHKPNAPDMSYSAKLLGWTYDPSPTNLCHGYFKEPRIVLDYPAPKDPKMARTTILADRSILLAKGGWSKLIGHVKFIQQGRIITANEARFYRDPKSKRITDIILHGNVHLHEKGKLVVSQDAHFVLGNKTGQLNHALYHLYSKSPTGFVDGWGRAQKTERLNDGNFIIYNGTYSTCSPTHEMWHLQTKHLLLDRSKHQGYAKHTTFYFGRLPILYAPYLIFPLNKDRQTGFLFPTFGYTRDSGTDITVPFYLNLAPNYDAKLRARILSKRGALLGIHFRYLTPHDRGFLNLNVLPNDREFKKFQNKTVITPSDSPYYVAAKKRLINDSDNRTYLKYDNFSHYGDHWTGKIHLNYLTDDYYFQDLGHNPVAVNTDQLLNQAYAKYQDEHWTFLALVQAYQTLHPINEVPTLEQYQRLPELTLTGDYPSLLNLGLLGDVSTHLYTQFVNFDQKVFANAVMPTGNRFHVAPRVSLPIINGSGHITPAFEYDATLYSLRNQPTGLPTNITRTLPIANVDAGLNFQRDMRLFGHAYEQTLEPRVYYLYVPFRNQNNIPIFDTVFPAFSYAQLFRRNRFVGIDRIGDTNQMTVGITSRILDHYTGEQKLGLSIAQAYYFQKRRVCLTPNCINDPTIDNKTSPIVGRLTYTMNHNWYLTGEMAWDTDVDVINNAGAHIHYQPSRYTVFNFGYDFVRNGDPLVTATPESGKNNLNRLNLGAAALINDHWSVVGNLNYNLSHGYPQTYLYGVEYNSCCWAIRFVTNRYLTANGQAGSPQFDRRYYVQIQFKGLGNLGQNQVSGLLKSTIEGYHDQAFQR